MQFKPIPVQLRNKWVVLRKEDTGLEAKQRPGGYWASQLFLSSCEGGVGVVCVPTLPACSWVMAKCESVLCTHLTPTSSSEHIESVPFFYLFAFNELCFQMLLVKVWMSSTVLGMLKWRIRKWEQDLASESGCQFHEGQWTDSQGMSGDKCLAHFRGGEFSWEYPTLNLSEFPVVEINDPL